MSQGTLSILTIFGLIGHYLKLLFPDAPGTDLFKKHAIVIIDELDAHLHPVWQQKIIGLLRKNFPNVQFIVTAQNPHMVAGCLDNEVSVLRKNDDNGKFDLEQYPHDFIGSEIDEIYSTVFEVEEGDEAYTHYLGKYNFSEKIDTEIEELSKVKEPTQEERKKLKSLYDERYYARKANDKQTEEIYFNSLLFESNKLMKERSEKG